MAGAGRDEGERSGLTLRSQLGVGVIGLGVGERHIGGYLKTGHCRVVALCDIDDTKLREVGARNPGPRLTTDPRDIFADPEIDVVSIASFDADHRDQVVAAIENGKHVFVEKPLCLTQDELDDIARTLARHAEIRLSSNLILRLAPRFIELRRRIRSGEVGRVYYMDGDYDYGRLHKITDGWRGKIASYSVVHGGAIHLIDLIIWLSGMRPDEVFAYGNKISTKGTGFRNLDLVAALLRFPDGTVAKIAANFGSVAPHHHRLSVFGTKATFEQSHIGAAYFGSRDPAAPAERLNDRYPGTAKGDMLQSFVAHILDRSPPDVTSDEVFDTMAVSLAIEKSVHGGVPEKVHYVEHSLGK
jgi:predicted dehydrogenase